MHLHRDWLSAGKGPSGGRQEKTGEGKAKSSACGPKEAGLTPMGEPARTKGRNHLPLKKKSVLLEIWRKKISVDRGITGVRKRKRRM